MTKKIKIENKKNRIIIKQKKTPKTLNRAEAKLPYIVVITKTPHNLFLNTTDFEGNTKIWESSGRCGFRGKSKTAYMAIVTTTDEFFKKIWHFGIRYIYLRTKGFFGSRRSLRKIIGLAAKKFKFKIIGIENKISVAFNGCKKKKAKRK